MIRYVIPKTTFAWYVCAAIIGIALFGLKYRVNQLENNLDDLNRQIVNTQESMDVLKAEWTYLNQPDHLQALNDKYLSLRPTPSTQVTTLEEVDSVLKTAPKPAVTEAVQR